MCPIAIGMLSCNSPMQLDYYGSLIGIICCQFVSALFLNAFTYESFSHSPLDDANKFSIAPFNFLFTKIGGTTVAIRQRL
jgi:hypothetical protein